MTRINFTLSEDTLHHLISGDDKGISLLLREVLNQVLEHQRTEQIDAAHYERTETRRGLRNGYKPRKLITRVGTLNLRVPQIRDGVFLQSFLEDTNVANRPLSLHSWKWWLTEYLLVRWQG